MTVTILFYLFAALTVIAALSVVTSRHPVRAVLSLVLAFVCAAVTWLLLEAEYLSLLLIVVYVGAVMVLFMFVVMMLDVDKESVRASIVRYWPVAIVVSVLMLVLMIWPLGAQHFGLSKVPAPQPLPADYSSIAALGELMFTKYLYPFELAAVILLAAMVAAITLTFRGRRPGVRGTAPHKQVQVKAAGRLRVVSMPSEKKKTSSRRGAS